MINSTQFIADLHAGRPLPYYDAEDLDDLAYELLTEMHLPEARAAIELCERTHPEYEDIRVARARLLVGTGQAAEALRLLSSLSSCSIPYERDLLRIHALLQLERQPEAMLEIKAFPEKYAADYNVEEFCLDLSDICLDCKFPEGRQYILEWGARKCPKNEEILAELSDYYAHSKQPARAVDMLQQLTEIRPLEPDYWEHLSLMQAELDHWEEALEAVNYALSLKPRRESMLMQKTHCLYNLGHWRQAMECALYYLSLMPKSAEEGMDSVRFSGICLAKGLLIDCYNEMHQYDKAQQTYNELLKLLE